MKSDSVEHAFHLTPLQKGMLFHHLQQTNRGVDIQQLVAYLEGTFNIELFFEAWRKVAHAHATLRTRFRWFDLPEPQQEILEKFELLYEVENLSSLPAGAQSQHIDTYLREDRRRGFDLARAPLSRFRFFRLSESELRFVWTFPHIILDSASFRIVLRDVFSAYDAMCEGKPFSLEAPPPYSEFIECLETEFASSNEAQKFFSEQLKGFTAINGLTRPVVEEVELTRPSDRFFQERGFKLSKELSDSLREVATKCEVTINTCVQAAWSLVISDFSDGSDDIVFGVVRAGRHSTVEDASKRVGLFINTVPFRVRIDREQSLFQLLSAVRKTHMALRPHEHTSLIDVQAVSEIPGGEALFESVLVFNANRFNGLETLPKGLTHCRFEWIEQTNFPVTLFGYAEQELEINLVWDPAHLTEWLAEGMLGRLHVVLETIANNPKTPLNDLVFQSAREREWLAKHSNTQVDYEESSCIHHFFEHQCDQVPEKVALIHNGEEISYTRLNARANAIAFQLQSRGVKPDVLVGVYMERSIEMVASLLGILKAGGAYLPLDPDFPSERITRMLQDCQLVLTEEKHLAQLAPHEAETLCVESIQGTCESAPETTLTSSHLSYVLFTSGSTGRPKGIMVEHRNASNFFKGMDQRIGTKPGVWLALTSISFDISVLELFWTLGRGFTVVLHDELTTAALRRSSKNKGAVASQSDRQTREIPMDFGLFFFASDASSEVDDCYRLLLDGARFADANGFTSVWTPERHFHEFGGIYPNPAVTGAAIAAITKNVQIRAGSCVLPLHHPIRVAEEWAVVDNLSGGRVGLSFASGWHPNDFLLNPQNYENRKGIMFDGIDTIKALWRGEAVEAENGHGEKISVNIFPSSIQKNPPIWLTTAGNIETFQAAGEMGVNLLTNLLGQSISELADKLVAYRGAWTKAGHSGQGTVSLMLHTFIGSKIESVRELVRRPFTDYLRTSTDLVKKANWYFPAFHGSGGEESKENGSDLELDELTSDETDALMDHAFERYFGTRGLFGTPESCLKIVNELKAAGVSEICCLIDFGVSTEEVLASLPYLNRLRELSQPNHIHVVPGETSIPAQIQQYGVTHMQCTPSLAQVILESSGARAAIGKLETVILGGEVLPKPQAEQFLDLLPENGRLLNMYGPTETTIWSTVADIKKDEEITIGTPIANTHLHVLDGNLVPTPLGIPGELYIGGAGVVRGYLKNKALTRDRFLPDISGDPGRMYRSGDRVRYLQNGSLEFLGRSDQQIKLHGHRIELGEIETTLTRHPDVEEAVVVVHKDGPREAQLIAYLRKNTPENRQRSDTTVSQVGEWQRIWQRVYEESLGRVSAGTLDADFNTAGWISSYTGQPFPVNEMQEWITEASEKITALKPRRLLEIGCGTGLLLFRVAPRCERYLGVDISNAAFPAIETACKRLGLEQVELIQSAANDLGAIHDGSFDVVAINSVAQYFPNADYLEKVLASAAEKLMPGGNLFIGDVRNLELAEAFYISLELAQAPVDRSLAKVKECVARRAGHESELMIAPDFFKAFAKKYGFEGLSIRMKSGAARNEMNDFRYDVVLRKRSGESIASNTIDHVIDGGKINEVSQLRELLLQNSGVVRVTRLLNARVERSVRAGERLELTEADRVSDLKTELSQVQKAAIHPHQIYELSPDYEIDLTYSSENAIYFEALLTPKSEAAQRFRNLSVEVDIHFKPLSAYVNKPGKAETGMDLKTELHAMLKDALPDYMVPNIFVFMDAFPLTPNGKIDRNVLPIPDTTNDSSPIDPSFESPTNELEQSIAEVWQEILGLERIGINADVLELGADSLMMMKAENRLRHIVKQPLSLRVLFECSSVKSLAARLS